MRTYELAIEPGDRAKEAQHEVTLRLVIEVIGGADLLDPPLVDHHDGARDLQRLLLVMGHEHSRDVNLVVQSPKPVPQFLADLGVECAERLIQQKHRGFDRERTGKSHALALAARELRGESVRELIEVDELEELIDLGLDLGLGLLADLQAEGDVAGNREMFEGGVVLEHEADVAALSGQVGRVMALDLDAAVVGALQAGDDAQQGRLATATWPEQRGEFAGRDAQIDVLKRDEVTELLVDAGDLNAHSSEPSLGRSMVTTTRAMTAMRTSTNAAAYAVDSS